MKEYTRCSILKVHFWAFSWASSRFYGSVERLESPLSSHRVQSGGINRKEVSLSKSFLS